MSRNEASRRDTLEPVFEENRSPARPLKSTASEPLPSPRSQVEIPLTPREGHPARVVIADDDPHALQAWSRSAAALYGGALDLRTWEPSKQPGHLGLVEQVRRWAAEGWRADVLVIDLNLDDGGRHGVHYLEDMRREPGFGALPVVLATSNQHSDLEQGHLSPNTGPNRTGESPRDWLKRLKPLEPEAVLFGKTGDAMFLGRVGSGLPGWQRAARRRTWVRLLSQVAEQLDNVRIGVGEIAEKIVRFVVDELDVHYAVVGQRVSDGRYQLLAQCPVSPHVHTQDLLHVHDVPVINDVVKDTQDIPEQRRKPLLVQRIGADAAGRFAPVLAQMQLLGAAAVLGNRSVGFIGLLRRPQGEPFDEEVDGLYLGLLVRLLASAIRVDLLRERQTRLLTFANQASTATRRREISGYLADILHDEVHHNSAGAGVTVRLIHFGNTSLEAKAYRGPAGDNASLTLRTGAHSVCADVARSNKARRIADTTLAADYVTGITGMRSELCVPLSVGGFALGVVNLEHPDVDFYRSSDESFVAAAAAVAASALERIRADRLLNDMTDFVLRFTSEETEALDTRLRDLLFLFCGYTALVELQAAEVEGAPWRVSRLHVPAGRSDEDALCREIERVYASEWPSTLMGRLVSGQDWKRDSVMFTKDAAQFRRIPLGADGEPQTADAVLWLRHDGAPPHRAMLLMWSLPPPIGDNDVRLLGTMARVFSQLHARKATIDQLIHKNLVGEQAALIGHVMQHFKHRIGNLTGSQSTHLDGLEYAFEDQDAQAFHRSLERARANTRDLANAFHKSHGYVKVPPDLADVTLRKVVDAAMQDLQLRLSTVTLVLEVPDQLAVHTDIDIASLVVYGLIENALDAVRERPEPRICLTGTALGDAVRLVVADNGHGVGPGMRTRLFSWGQTTKGGLGSALAFARERVRTLGGRLEFSAVQPAQGASFELVLPAARPAGDTA